VGLRDILRKIGELADANHDLGIIFSVGQLTIQGKNLSFDFDAAILKQVTLSFSSSPLKRTGVITDALFTVVCISRFGSPNLPVGQQYKVEYQVGI